jgi:hypothetical protein
MSQKTREPVDMSPRAVARRLDEVRELFRLTEYLSKFRPVKQEKPSQKSDRR